MDLNLEKMYAKFRDIEESVARLKQFRKIPVEDFLADRDSQDIASFRLIVATEAAIDTCLHLSARMLKMVPEEYAACFHLLAEHGLIDRGSGGPSGPHGPFPQLADSPLLAH